MQIMINGDPAEVSDGSSVHQLVLQLELADKRIAVELNCEIVPRSQFSEMILTADDRVEIVQAIGGG
ncbi:MAG: sulfur carrier protein ThiS [Pseudomonadales bacterium]|nr:sulfur carrier protein ThiS [Pseudomonadales bacterium]